MSSFAKSKILRPGLVAMTKMRFSIIYIHAENVTHRKFSFVAPHDDGFVLVLINWGDENVEVTVDCAHWDSDDDEE